MPDPALPAPGLSEILLRGRVSLPPGKLGGLGGGGREAGSDVAAGPGVAPALCRRSSGRPGPDDSGAVCEAGGPPGAGGAAGLSMCPLCSPGIESHSGPGRPHLGSPPRSGWVQDGSRTGRPAPQGPAPGPGSPLQPFSLRSSPASLDAFVFGYLAPLLQARLPSGRLQAHLRGLHNLCAYCAHILSLYFPWDGGERRAAAGRALAGAGGTQEPTPPPLPASLLSGGAASTPDASGPRGRGGAVPAPEPGAVRAGGAGGHGGLRLAQRHRLYPAGGTRPGPRHAVPEHGRRGGRRVTPPRAPGTDFSTLTHSRGSSASPLLVRLENGRHSHNKAVHAGCSRTFSFLRDRHLSRSCWLVGGRPSGA